jgi:hypothetical protein
MTTVTGKEFLTKLMNVVKKLEVLANTQGYRFKTKWKEYLNPVNDKPHLVRQIKLDKEKFIEDIEYRIKILKEVEQAFVDGFHTIKSLLKTLYSSYFQDNCKLFIKNYSKEDQLILKYYVAREILGNLVQFNQLEHESVPLKYNIIARNYLLIKMNGQIDSEILENMKKLQMKDITLENINNLMEEVEAEGLVTKSKKGENYFYELKKELKLSEEGVKYYEQTLYPLVEWPTQFWRSFYNIREINVTVDNDTPHHEFLNKILSRSATQGYSPCVFVFKNLIKYFEEIKEEEH